MNAAANHAADQGESKPAQGRPAESCVMVVFGATGDLTKRKLIPALYKRAKANLLSQRFALVGAALDDLSAEAFRGQLSKDLREFATA